MQKNGKDCTLASLFRVTIKDYRFAGISGDRKDWIYVKLWFNVGLPVMSADWKLHWLDSLTRVRWLERLLAYTRIMDNDVKYGDWKDYYRPSHGSWTVLVLKFYHAKRTGKTTLASLFRVTYSIANTIKANMICMVPLLWLYIFSRSGVQTKQTSGTRAKRGISLV